MRWSIATTTGGGEAAQLHRRRHAAGIAGEGDRHTEEGEAAASSNSPAHVE